MLESFPIQQREIKILNPEVCYCKSFVLSICFPSFFFLLHDLWDVPAPPAVVVLLCLEMLSRGFLHSCSSGDSSPSTWWDRRKGKQFSFFHHRVHHTSRFSCSAPLSVKMATRADFPSPGSNPTDGAGGGERRVSVFAQLCFPRFTQAGKAASQNWK